MNYYRSTRIYTAEGIVNGLIGVKDHKIVSIIQGEADVPYIDFHDLRIIPGIIDTHNHGAVGYNFDDCVTKDEVKKTLLGEASFGVTGIFTTIKNLPQFSLMADVAEEEVVGAKILGIHSEGPWGSRVGEKGDPNNTYYKPVDLNHAKAMYDNSRGWLKLVALAPEVPQALEAIRYLTSLGVTVSAYHTNANYAQANLGIDNGITVATHLGNVMTGLHHRDIGTMGACLLRDEVTCELICDGLHVSLPMIKLILKLKDHNKIMMVSDNIGFAGAPVGKYRGSADNANNDRKVIIVTPEGFVVSETGRLSGSSKPVLYGIRNLVNELGMDLPEVLRMSSSTAAFKYQLTKRGSIMLGNYADFVVIDDDYQVQATFCEGRQVYEKGVTKIELSQSLLDSKLD